jgi:hypothetical protein
MVSITLLVEQLLKCLHGCEPQDLGAARGVDRSSARFLADLDKGATEVLISEEQSS